MNTTTKLVTGAAALVTAGSLAFAGASLASADDSTPSPSSTSSGQDTDSAGDANGSTGSGQGDRGPGMRHRHTEVTGEELSKVEEAVSKKDSAVTIERVMKDPDGSYDVMGTKSGARVMVEVSKDLATIEVRTGGPGGPGGRGGHGHGPGMRHRHTEVTGEELSKVEEAVSKKDSAVTIERVMKDPDGSYDVMGTKSGARVMVEVSKDLATIEVRTGGPGGPGMGDRRGPDASQGTPQQGSPQQGTPGQGTATPDDGTPTTVPSTGTSPTDIPTTDTTRAA